jgi:hypothetical protein
MEKSTPEMTANQTLLNHLSLCLLPRLRFPRVLQASTNKHTSRRSFAQAVARGVIASPTDAPTFDSEYATMVTLGLTSRVKSKKIDRFVTI